jgi:hypothetical protein
MDVVYVCRNGENQELRYSLRSLVNAPHDRVWVFGGHPAWISNVTVVTTPQRGLKYAITTASLRQACEHPEVSDPFWLWNDDFYAIAPSRPDHYHRGPVRDVLAAYERQHPTGIYTRGMRNTLAILEAHGHHDPLSYELHVPLVVHKKPMLEAIALGEGQTCWHKRTAYGNIAGLGGELTDDVKVTSSASPIPEGPWMSSSDKTFGLIRKVLGLMFPEPSRYEA